MARIDRWGRELELFRGQRCPWCQTHVDGGVSLLSCWGCCYVFISFSYFFILILLLILVASVFCRYKPRPFQNRPM